MTSLENPHPAFFCLSSCLFVFSAGLSRLSPRPNTIGGRDRDLGFGVFIQKIAFAALKLRFFQVNY